MIMIAIYKKKKIYSKWNLWIKDDVLLLLYVLYFNWWNQLNSFYDGMNEQNADELLKTSFYRSTADVLNANNLYYKSERCIILLYICAWWFRLFWLECLNLSIFISHHQLSIVNQNKQNNETQIETKNWKWLSCLLICI
jgi:hypothetical protein